MGRPLRKDVNGVDVIGTFTGAAGIKVQFYAAGSLNAAGYIVKQIGARTYYVTSNGTDIYRCKLVSTTPDANGEMMIYGYTDPGVDASLVVLKKLQKRTAIDYSGNRYKWYLSQYADSTGDIIVLTAI